MICVSRNGFNTSRSLSPVIMQVAFPATANSINMLSFGSRQAVILTLGSMNNAFCSRYFKTLFLVCRLTYLSRTTLIYSSLRSSLSLSSVNPLLFASYCIFLTALINFVSPLINSSMCFDNLANFDSSILFINLAVLSFTFIVTVLITQIFNKSTHIQ